MLLQTKPTDFILLNFNENKRKVKSCLFPPAWRRSLFTALSLPTSMAGMADFNL
jgi:hypothetical protein